MDTRSNRKLFSTTGIILIFLLVIGCQDNFSPLTENDQYNYTMNGVLDLHADTQWVRVMPIGETLIPTSSEPNNIEVTLTRVETSETTVLQDSLFIFGGDAKVWNYWTTEPLHSNERYTIRVDGSEGTSRVTVITPSPLPLPVVATNSEETKGVIRGSSTEPLVTADIKLFIKKIEIGGLSSVIEITSSHLNDVHRDLNGGYSFTFDINDIVFQETGIAPNGYVMVKKELIIAAGSEDWPDYSTLNDQEAVLPSEISNVENGTGFVAGIAKREVPLKSCHNKDGKLIPCQQ